MKAFKRSGTRWYTRSKPELLQAWPDMPVIQDLIACSIEHCVLVPSGEVLRAKTTHYTVGDLQSISLQRPAALLPRCRDKLGPQRCELLSQHRGDHMNVRFRWERIELPWVELRGTPAERYRAGLRELAEERQDEPRKNEGNPAAQAAEDARAAALNDLWWQMSPAEQADFEAWWSWRLWGALFRTHERGRRLQLQIERLARG